jgi:hypothetical protein
MKEYNLKLILTILSGIVFSFIFILLAFILPTRSTHVAVDTKPTHMLGEVSKSLKK